MSPDKPDLRQRTTAYALCIVQLYSSLPKSTVAHVLGTQLLRSGTSVGAHYREAMHGKSKADFVSKLEGALQELEETDYWLDLLLKSETIPRERTAGLIRETNELIAIFIASIKTARQRLSAK